VLECLAGERWVVAARLLGVALQVRPVQEYRIFEDHAVRALEGVHDLVGEDGRQELGDSLGPVVLGIQDIADSCAEVDGSWTTPVGLRSLDAP
jgi:hypothetical protein